MRHLVVAVLVFSSLVGVHSEAKVSAVLSGQALRKEVAAEASQNHHAVGYNTARKDLMGKIALEQNNNHYFIMDVYCQEEFTSKGPGFLPDNSVLNVEHTWPQSKFGGNSKGSQKSDLHHLYPTDAEMNSTRGNHPFGNVVTPRYELKCKSSQFGDDENGTLVFEPPSNHKGNVARSLFYFAVRYDMTIDKNQEEVLRQWHEQDPVDAQELARDEAISELQGNHNPFILQPELVERLEDF